MVMKVVEVALLEVDAVALLVESKVLVNKVVVLEIEVAQEKDV